MKQKGLTLIEVLISALIAVMAGGLLLAVIVNSTNFFYKQSAKVNIGLNANDALAQISQNIKESAKVAPSYSPGAETYTSGATQLILKVPSQDPSGSIISDTFDYFVYFLDQSSLRLKTFPDILSVRKPQDRIFSTNVDSLFFQYLNSQNPPAEITPAAASKVRVTLTLNIKSGMSFETNTATTEANLRNK